MRKKMYTSKYAWEIFGILPLMSLEKFHHLDYFLMLAGQLIFKRWL